MGAGLAKPMVDMNRRNLVAAIKAEAMLTGDPLSYFRTRMAEPPPPIKKSLKTFLWGDKRLEAWQERQKGLRSDLVNYINGAL